MLCNNYPSCINIYSHSHIQINIFCSAQKMAVPVDSLVLSPGESSFLQQAALITGGIYLRPKDQRAVTQLLLYHYLPSTYSRKILVSPTQVNKYINTKIITFNTLTTTIICVHIHQRNVDFRASCFCHQNPVEFAFMCSVCLALTCEIAADEACATCGSKRSRAAV